MRRWLVYWSTNRAMTTCLLARMDRQYSTSARRGGRFAQRPDWVGWFAEIAIAEATVPLIVRAARATTLDIVVFSFTISDGPRFETWCGEASRKSGLCRSAVTRRAVFLSDTTSSRKPTCERRPGEWRWASKTNARSTPDSNPSLDILWTYLHNNQCKLVESRNPVRLLIMS